MSVNKVELSTGEVLIDISNDKVTSDTVFEGVTAHNAKGEQITGTFPNGEIDTQTDLIEQIKTALDGKAAGGGKNSEPDLVIGYTLPNSEYSLNTGNPALNDFTIKSGSVSNTYDKLINKEEVKILVEYDYHYDIVPFKGTVAPVFFSAVDNKYRNEQYIALTVWLELLPGGQLGKYLFNLTVGFDGTIRSVVRETVNTTLN